jgi:hypothetical protein
MAAPARRPGVTGLCLDGAFLPALAFTLSWMHSVERTEWQEDYRIESGHLVLVEARIRGSGAGMEPPAGAVLADGWWHYRPNLPPLPELRLARSTATEDYWICWAGACRPLAAVAPPRGEGSVTVVRACAGPDQR